MKYAPKGGEVRSPGDVTEEEEEREHTAEV